MRKLLIVVCLAAFFMPAVAPAKAVSVAPGPFWRWPLLGTPWVVNAFDPPAKPWLPGHRGVDLGAEADAVVLAAGPGQVRFAGVVVSRPLVSISHPNGLITTYEPVASLVKAGDQVAAGQPIGTLRPGHADCPAACLHWGLRSGETYLDPLALLSLARVRLLPTTRPASRRREAGSHRRAGPR
ncbi:MAG TPA: peptidase M23 [Micromonosporaceae bacterium]|nr:peptidase M23 [Micromonosporaceae bacterium]